MKSRKIPAPGETVIGGTFLPAYRVTAIDTTATGDVFSGALACGIAEGKTLFESAQIANAVAALSVTRLGAQPSLPTKKELELFSKHQSYTLHG
ncbi:MAG: PfkB family carbohydrate kinase [Planctomycetaceae bacterium]|nr:PfkB family carbohydrate kinase [Planctomycetaceae bacterium]